MSLPVQPVAANRPAGSRLVWLLVPLLPALALAVVVAARSPWSRPAQAAQVKEDKPAKPEKDEPELRQGPMAPELEGGTAWLNTAGPLRLKDLRGKVIVLDFWTLCCINCIHTLPDLARLEKKYPNELVVIGIHSPKFDNEKDTNSIRKAILRYEIGHPVINDAKRALWDAYDAEAWPSLYVIDPEGRVVGRGSGEGLYEALDEVIAKIIKVHKEKKTLNEKPIKFELARFSETGDSPLFFPGKVLADEASKRLFIADSTHHRIVVTDLDGKMLAVAGMGKPGRQDGAFARAQFDDPQGMALHGDTLYVADRKNHLIRALDLKAQTVRTVAGTGEQGRHGDPGDEPLKTGLNSPWDLLRIGDTLYIAMAGNHQIWTMDLKKGSLAVYAGAGPENIRDGPLLGDPRRAALFAQPSGLTTDGTNLYVADSEVSAVRSVPLGGEGLVKTLVGKALFEFGDIDGTGDNVRIQHALGVASHQGVVYVADTYNSKIKVLDPKTRSCQTFVGGEPEGWLGTPLFSEPAGLSYAAGKLYVADTNAHRIRVVDLKTKLVTTLKLQGLEAPKATP
jgi:thiol-disulfide isomerase/thioredoxin